MFVRPLCCAAAIQNRHAHSRNGKKGPRCRCCNQLDCDLKTQFGDAGARVRRRATLRGRGRVYRLVRFPAARGSASAAVGRGGVAGRGRGLGQ